MALQKPYQKTIVQDNTTTVFAEHHNKQERQLEAITDLLPAGGFFTEGAGTDAAIGRGVTTPTAAGANALAQGDGCAASGANSFAQGYNAFAKDETCFAQGSYVGARAGQTNVSLTKHSFFQGRNCVIGTAGAYEETTSSNFFQGYKNYGGYAGANSWPINCMMQGYDNYMPWTGSGSIIQGYGNRLYDGSQCIVQGSDHYVDSARYVLCQGSNNTAKGGTNLNTFIQGKGNYVYGGYQLSTQGYYNHSYYNWYSMIQGRDNYIHSTSTNKQVMVQGKSNYVQNGRAQSILVQGYGNYAENDSNNVMIQGDSNKWYYGNHCLVQGAGNHNSPTAYGAYYQLVQGQNNNLGGDRGYYTFIQGYNNSMAAGHGVVMQGADNQIVGDTAYQVAIIGKNNYVYNGYSTFVHGTSNNIYGSGNYYAQVFGEQNKIYTTCPGTFVAGHSNVVLANSDYSLVQGNANQVSASRCFAQGNKASATIDDQKSWGTNRNGTAGAAQSSEIHKYLQTAADGMVTIATIPITAKGYCIAIWMSAIRPAAPTEVATFTLTQATAYLNGANAAVVGSPVALTKETTAVGNIANLAAQVTVSGANVVVQVDGNAGETHEWVCTIKLTEVA